MGFSVIVVLVMLVCGVLGGRRGPVDPTLNASAFKVDFTQLTGTTGVGGTATFATKFNTPSLVGSGLTMAKFVLQPGGANAPHIHPRGSEAIVVFEGSLRCCFAEENGGVTRCNDLKPGEMTFFPIGTIHYQQNFGQTTATYFAVLDSDFPGTVTVANRFFTLPNEILSAAFNLPPEDISRIREGLPSSPIGAGPGATPAATLDEALIA
uniref:Cupin type-1 domain-containing protein n=1 Tax=Compsopogon caeruleus TaxID=31354 RepID=A0A7S1T4H6_9RHOD|mmetsp:Transcript_10161/g.20521  ORF Transcript_10161/g.20521 Transcript_10161/m.20521 type:complete len:209 (+) Transcript_10161:77-703(+)|eukprot:CAMPEP_0184682062 /NCGR_PEP_ID=MMETSP0312-20130426/5591_1 /TAXON_ID=31354 /ORGANISM="Compsopogon coeruleus, Strain SAG 36.94" /LENGTH=208 /DNA_ID=CAMNT_0027133371 /DNA_START=63 /DNA_END=689 /DNA_ORIENTATION=-